MTTTAAIHYRNAAHKAAHEAAAARAGANLSEWLRAVWEHYSGGEKAPRGYVLKYAAGANINGEPADPTTSRVRGVSKAAQERQQAAADAARMTLTAWRLVVADVAAGVSDLGRQLRR